MSARHRVSKLLLGQGILYSSGNSWTSRQELWLRAQRFDRPALQLSYEAAFYAMLARRDRRDRLNEAITAMGTDQRVHPGRAPIGLYSRNRNTNSVRVGRRDP